MVLGGSSSIYISIFPEVIGGLTIGGCSVNYKKYSISFKFKENDIAYIKFKAEKGILEKIAVKAIYFNQGKLNSFSQGGKRIIIYIDSLNALYMEHELVTRIEAEDLITTYYNTKVSNIDKLIDATGCR